MITLLTDFGSADIYVGVLHGVIAQRCPSATVIDVTHQVRAGDVLAGALALADALAYLPVGVHVGVVDRGVGTQRRAVALRCADGRVLIGPDNGLLMAAAGVAGGVLEAVEISDSPWRLEPVSATFHGRDIFAPVAAAIAGGEGLSDAGAPLAADQLVELARPDAELSDGVLVATVTAVDRFGNLALLALPAEAAAAGLMPGGIVNVTGGGRRLHARFGRTFSDVGPGRLLLHEDSTGRLALAVNGGAAAELLGVSVGGRLSLSRVS